MGRKDGELIKKIDSMHVIMPLIFPNRCDNEAFISECVDLANVNAYLEKKNAANPEYHYNLFQVIVTALLKTMTLRPQMNRFITNYSIYQRNELTAAFTVKKIFKDDGGESLARLCVKGEDTIETVHQEIYKQVAFCKNEAERDSSTESMDTLQKLPGPILKIVGAVCRFLDQHGWMPKSMLETDPYQCSVIFSNLGSIKLHAAYHHLANWGTTSVFCVIGEKKKRPFYDEDGTVHMKDSVDLGLVIDERIADGYYYSQTVRLFLKLLENPELLERPMNEPVDLK